MGITSFFKKIMTRLSLIQEKPADTKKAKRESKKRKSGNGIAPPPHKASGSKDFACSNSTCWCRQVKDAFFWLSSHFQVLFSYKTEVRQGVEERTWLRTVDKQLLEAAFHGNLHGKVSSKGSNADRPASTLTGTVLQQLLDKGADVNVFDRVSGPVLLCVFLREEREGGCNDMCTADGNHGASLRGEAAVPAGRGAVGQSESGYIDGRHQWEHGLALFCYGRGIAGEP